MPCYRAERLVVGGGVEQGSGEDRSLGIKTQLIASSVLYLSPLSIIPLFRIIDSWIPQTFSEY